jgi:DNA-binding NarL/FixJ family response regulator
MLISKRILVADDSDTVRRVICTCLTERNFHVCGDAANGEEVIEKARLLKPDLILLDLAMPRTNGIVVASVLKEMMPNVRIVLFTMYSEAVHRTFSPKGIAVDAVIAKGEGMLGLIDCIHSLLPS